jgi:two-component system chemotaxis response regulator CheY
MKKILVIDDNPDILELVSETLEEAGYQVKTANDGIEGVQIFKEYLPQLLITDITMPGKDGLEVIIELRDEFPDLMIMAISGNYDSSISMKAAKVFHEREDDDPEYFLDAADELGADYVLEKPFSNKELIRIVKELMAKGRTKQMEKEDDTAKDPTLKEIMPSSLARLKKQRK